MLKADYTEDLVTAMISTYIMCSFDGSSPIFINPISRQEENRPGRGYDARIYGTRFRPLYLQFKKPSAYQEASTSQIIKDRKRLGLEVSPNSLFFKLHPRKKGATDSQHNILYKLSKKLELNSEGNAAYVCPLFLSSAEYQLRIQISSLINRRNFLHPIYYGHLRIRDISDITEIIDTPMLNGHITIAPHRSVTHENHKYCFSEKGNDISFHSKPERLEKSRLLSTLLIDNYKALNENYLIFGESDKYLHTLFAEVYGDEQWQEFNLMDSREMDFAKWIQFGNKLQLDYGITQVLLTDPFYY